MRSFENLAKIVAVPSTEFRVLVSSYTLAIVNDICNDMLRRIEFKRIIIRRYLFILPDLLLFLFFFSVKSAGYTSHTCNRQPSHALHRIASIRTCNVLLYRLSSLSLILSYIRRQKLVHGALNRFVVTFANARCSPPYRV